MTRSVLATTALATLLPLSLASAQGLTGRNDSPGIAPDRAVTWPPRCTPSAIVLPFAAVRMVEEDLDGDGLSDLAVLEDDGASFGLSVVLRAPSGGLLDPVAYATGFGPVDVVDLDLNADGAPDLLVANSVSNSLSILLNGGDGTFVQGDQVPTGDPHDLAVGDLDGDGVDDVAVANLVTGTIGLFMNTGSGSLSFVQSIPTGGTPGSVVITDLDGDGAHDLAVTNAGVAEVLVFHNQGNGAFSEPFVQVTKYPVRRLVACELDGDGRVDLAALGGYQWVVTLLNKSDLGFDVGYQNVPFAPLSLCTMDLDGDGLTDLATANDLLGEGTASVLLNVGDGSTFTVEHHDLGRSARSIFALDVDFDEDADLAIANETGISFLTNRGGGDFDDRSTSTIANANGITTADLDRDGIRDVIVAGDFDSIAIHEGRPDGGYEAAVGFDSGLFLRSFSPVARDFDGDGWMDVAVYRFQLGSIGVFMNQGGTLLPASDHTMGFASTFHADDLDGDGHPDLVSNHNFVHGSSGSVNVRLNQGDGTFSDVTSQSHDGVVWDVATGDFDGDGDAEIIVLRDDSVVVTDFENEWIPGTTVIRGLLDPRLALAGDFNADGKTDIAVVCASPSLLALHLQVSPSSFVALAPILLPDPVQEIRRADLDRDGDLDLVLGFEDRSHLEILYNLGDATFDFRRLHLPSDGESFALADLDGDADIDILVLGRDAERFHVIRCE